jgi:serine/threonine protein phosphatase PrpC
MKQPSPRDHLEVSVEGVAAVTDRGRVHHRNEDAFALHAGAGRVVAVVCDGVSTTVNPHLASEAAADAALGVLAGEGPPPPEERLLQAAVAARAAVEAVDGQPEPPGLGWPSCTFLAAVADAGTVDLATLGDCRAYWMASGGAAEVLTEDDSWAAEQVAAGALTPEVAYEHAFAHTITRWLGRDGDPSWAPRLARFEPPAPGRLVLCSDGLWNYAGAGPELAQAAGEGDLLTVARRLVTFANDAGGHDNITVVVLDVPPPAGAEPVAGSPAEPVTPEPRKGPPS